MFLVCGEALFDFFLESEAGPAAVNLRRPGRRLAVQRRDRARAARPGVGAADRPLDRPPRPAARRRCSTTRACRRAYAIPTDRPTTMSLVGLDTAGVPAYQFYDNGSADTGVSSRRPAGARAGGHRACISAPTRSPRHRSPTPSRRSAASNGGRFISLDPNVRPTVEPDMDVWRARMAVLFPLADLVKISAEDLELLRPGIGGSSLAADLVAAGVTASSW